MHVDWQLTVLLALMLVGAVIAVETRDLLSAVIAVGVVGFGTSLGFLMLGAPDLAITQVVVEIIVLVILVRATVIRDETVVHRYRDTFAVTAGMITLGVLFVACLGVYARKGEGRGLPKFGDPVALRPYTLPPDVRRMIAEEQRGNRKDRDSGTAQSATDAREALLSEQAQAEKRGVSRAYLDESVRARKARENAGWNARNRNKEGFVPRNEEFKPKGKLHVPNRVTAVILDYRAYDTLGEATVILAAIVGALVILRKRGRAEGHS